MKAHPVLLQLKYARIVKGFAKEFGVPLRDALDMFYKSGTYKMVSRGIANMHCRSDGFLIEELAVEYGYKTLPYPQTPKVPPDYHKKED